MLFRTATFSAEELFKTKISTVKLLFQNSYFYTALTFSEELHIGKSKFSEKQILHFLLFLVSYLFWTATFSKDVTFYSSYLFRRAAFSQDTFPEELLFHCYASFPQQHFQLQLVIKWAQYQLYTVKMWEFFLVYMLLLKVAHGQILFN